MVYFGKIKNGKIELDAQTRLPEGSIVRVEAVAAAADPLDGLGLESVDCGPQDLSAEHDHYIYGAPKRGEPKKG